MAGGANAAGAGDVGGVGGAQGGAYEILAQTQRHLFAPVTGSAAAPPVEQCDLVLCSFETLRDELRKTQRTEGGMDLPLGALGFWRVVLDEAQLVSQTTSKAALICSELWRRHAWVATGTPINAKVAELHGLLAFLGTAPFKEEHAFNSLLLRGYKQREPDALYRMRTLLRALCLRRSKSDPAVHAQIALPPMEWVTRTLAMSAVERVRYELAVGVLRRSHRAYARAATSKARGGVKSRLLGQLSGDLTRLRQTVCHPSVVNAARPRGAGNSVRGGLVGGVDGTSLPHAIVLRRLIARAAADRAHAVASHLRARVMLHVTQRSVGVAIRSRDEMELSAAWPAVAAEMEVEHGLLVEEGRAEKDEEAARLLHGARAKLGKVHTELKALLEDDEALQLSEETCALATATVVGGKRRRAAVAGSTDERRPRRNERGGGRSAGASDSGGGGGSGGGSSGSRGKGGKSAKAQDKASPSARESAAVVRVLVGDAAKAVAKAAAAERDKKSTHQYLCSLASPTHGDDEHDHDDDDGEHADSGGADGGDGGGEGGDGATDTCPICLDGRVEGSTWAITACGHSGCYECMATALTERKACPCCKQRMSIDGLYEIAPATLSTATARATTSVAAAATAPTTTTATTAATASELPMPEAALDEYGTKICALLVELGRVHAAGGKAVVFSAWTRLLALAHDALDTHRIPCASLVGSPAAKAAALAAFASPAASVLLVPLFGGASGAGGGGAAGLTLTQARLAVLLEPALQPGIERQAAGRICRIGQSKACTCVRLIVDDTIESKILRWQQIRLADGASANPTLTLNDFAALAE